MHTHGAWTRQPVMKGRDSPTHDIIDINPDRLACRQAELDSDARAEWIGFSRELPLSGFWSNTRGGRGRELKRIELETFKVAVTVTGSRLPAEVDYHEGDVRRPAAQPRI